MIRHVSLEEISDGKLYNVNDMAKAGCGDCEGCFACCRGMGHSILLDPLDACRLCNGLDLSFEQLLAGPVELNVADGLVLPNLRMAGPGECCSFLDANGRCSVHSFRPGICRLFPLGRYYHDRTFSYFLQSGQCRKENRAKVKVRQWIDTPDLKNYEAYVCEWHYFLKDICDACDGAQEPSSTDSKTASLYLLNRFYLLPWQPDDFFGQFHARLCDARKELLNAGR